MVAGHLEFKIITSSELKNRSCFNCQAAYELESLPEPTGSPG